MSKTNINSQQKTEMLDEYDFSEGIRGKYYQQYQNNNLPPLKGIQFLTNKYNRKTGVFIDFQKHQQLWETLINKYNNLENIQLIADLMNHIMNQISCNKL